MRILMTTDTIGGVWTYTRQLAAELLANGCAVALVSFGRIPSPSQLDWVALQSSRYGARFRFTASDLPLEWMQANDRAFTEAEPLLLRIAAEFRADLLLTSQYCFGALASAMPRIVVAHSDVLGWAKACGRPLESSPWLRTYRELVAEGLRYADALVAPTRWMLDALAENFTLSRDARVIANGRTAQSPLPPGERKLQAVTAGRLWDPGKNLELLSAVRAPMPILVAGDLEHQDARFSADATGKAILLGPLDEHEMLALFSQSSIYVCTSRYEPFGLAPLEAALCGCAVLANDIPSLREVWGDGALYFRDSQSLSGLLAVLGDDRRMLDHARARSRSRALQFSARRMAEGYMELFHDALRPALIGHVA